MPLKILCTPILATYVAVGNQSENKLQGFPHDTNTESLYKKLLSSYKNSENFKIVKKFY